jgi:type IV pilus assembly protein PilA
MSQSLRKKEEAFNLTELLIVILIIGILAAIAIPFFLNQRKSAIDASVISDVRNADVVVRTWIGKKGTAEALIPADWNTDFQGSKAADNGTYKDIKVTLSSGTIMKITGTSYHYVITANNPNGDQSAPASGGVAYDSENGTIKSGASAGSAGLGDTTANPAAGQTANCGGGVYTVIGTGTTISCSASPPTGKVTLYTLTVRTTSTTPIQWSVNADWSGVQQFNSLNAWSPDSGVFESLRDYTALTYTFSGTDKSWNHDPNASNNWQYISSSKAPIVIDVNITAGR